MGVLDLLEDITYSIDCDLLVDGPDDEPLPCTDLATWTVTVHDCLAAGCASRFTVCSSHLESLKEDARRLALRPKRRGCGTKPLIFEDTLSRVEPLGSEAIRRAMAGTA